MLFSPKKLAHSAKALFTTKVLGDVAEDLALAYLRQAGLGLISRNYRTPGRGGGEIDLIMHETSLKGEKTCVFVEVRHRSSTEFGGAAASVSIAKKRRIVLAAQHYLSRFAVTPACRFDVVTVDGQQIQWLKAAFQIDDLKLDN